eukprot:CAMPEP_0176360746 /NCGR_PEP_ID=MMETSP0126-20121128/17284_1 /TAXON_ID=141414 ORGANISM="Strombidinopsis acuminatum, Strain SPMC142" /NCGR_SAMPLE_ID=MMETSP0126 /ASSEMBLY_ACC=CAM_ASM_000229 /LENGTH=77 /DNA_ID=CAMNT_0017716067 /DNA_START=1204 /DNA_END=1437 /DNA_ORIENTATION=-
MLLVVAWTRKPAAKKDTAEKDKNSSKTEENNDMLSTVLKDDFEYSNKKRLSLNSDDDLEEMSEETTDETSDNSKVLA